MSNVLKALARGGAAETDPNFKQTVLLLHGDGTNGAQNNTFLDGSTNNFTITRNGNTTQGTFSPFSVGAGEWSNYFDGTDDRLSNTTGGIIDFGTNPFTVEMWVYITSTNNQMFLEGPSNTGFQLFLESGVLKSGISGSAPPLTYTVPTSFYNSWNHIAVVREGTGTNEFKLYVNGTQQSQGTMTSNFTTTGFQVARTTAYTFFGYMSNLRVVKGTAVYTAAFTPPTTPLTAITNTSLLTCQSNRFVDNSTNAFAITRNGDVKVTPFSPFAPTAAYSAGTNGGSGYFDGSGDTLTVPSSSALEPGSGNFTIELWFYPLALPGVAQFLIYRPNSSGFSNFSISHRSTGAIEAYMSLSNPSSTPTLITAGNCPVGSWSHIVYTKNNLTYTLYINGAQVGTHTAASHPPIGLSTSTEISNTTYPVNGYIAGLKVIKGSAVAPSGVPTTPPVDSSGTSLLLNFTNAGIFDNTGKNNLETVGNAQIDTAVKKFGTGSLEFDGTGDWLRTPSSPDLDLGTGAATVECWLYITAAIQDYRVIVSDATNGFNYVTLRGGGTGGRVEVQVNNTGYQFDLNNSISQNTWAHLAVVRSGNTFTVYVNGSSLGTATSSAAWNLGNGGMFVGRWGGATAYEWPGYIDDLRITKGVARYTSNFTPPTKEFPDL